MSNNGQLTKTIDITFMRSPITNRISFLPLYIINGDNLYKCDKCENPHFPSRTTAESSSIWMRLDL